MKPSSAKAKGRKLQQWVVDKLVAILGFDPEDLESRPMGSSGEDVIMGVQSRKQFPYSIECKNQQAVNVWKAYEQSCANCKDYEPLVIIKSKAVSQFTEIGNEERWKKYLSPLKG